MGGVHPHFLVTPPTSTPHPAYGGVHPHFMVTPQQTIIFYQLDINTLTYLFTLSSTRVLDESQRCRLLPAHACQLMQLSVEGLQVPHVRNASDDEKQAFTDMIDRTYKLWLTSSKAWY